MEITSSDIAVVETGEVHSVCWFVMPNQGDWDKAWFGSILTQCKISGMKTLKVLVWMVENRDYGSNKVGKTQREIAEGCMVSLGVVNKALADFSKSGLLKKLKNGQYMINPAIIVRGSEEKQRFLLLEFNNG